MTHDDLNYLAWPAMRYALGRETYVVQVVCRALINNAQKIRNDIKYRMAEEIAKAINSEKAGMDCDVEEWQKVLKEFERTKND